jgi:Uma2 family endonuclease
LAGFLPINAKIMTKLYRTHVMFKRIYRLGKEKLTVIIKDKTIMVIPDFIMDIVSGIQSIKKDVQLKLNVYEKKVVIEC